MKVLFSHYRRKEQGHENGFLDYPEQGNERGCHGNFQRKDYSVSEYGQI